MSEHTSDELALVSGLGELADLIGRRDWDAAQSLGQRLVAAYPTSPSAHAALGDIAAARGQYREASQWYELAVRLEPNPEVQARLDRVRQAQAMGEAAEDQALSGTPRPPRVNLVIAGIGAFVLLALLVSIATVRLISRPRAAREASEQRSSRPAYRPGLSSSGGPGQLPTPPTTRPSARPMALAGAGKTTAPAPAVKAQSGPTVTQRITQSVAGPMSDGDLYLTRSLATVTWPTGNPIGADLQASLDPFTGYCLVTVQIPKGLPKAPLYPMVVDTAYTLAVNALRTDRTVDSMTIRFLATLVNERGKDTVLVAFRGNTNRATVEYYTKRNTQPDRDTLWQHVFATTWWNPSVPAN